MTYKFLHLRSWLNNHLLISISSLEKISETPKDTIRHFKEGRRDLPLKHFNNVVKVLQGYGYAPLESE
ncbi:hypothetical protein [Tenacibaculum ovolyticum]|uniref:hypothetical protein n=1 Tax=Tenacibaculum ovolyticum TaxID=104270 RepID=UPI0007ED0883|nr:hypothetical protein [Tenacibaculum ovolyticum]